MRDYDLYKTYCDKVDDQSQSAYTLRGLMQFASEFGLRFRWRKWSRLKIF